MDWRDFLKPIDVDFMDNMDFMPQEEPIIDKTGSLNPLNPYYPPEAKQKNDLPDTQEPEPVDDSQNKPFVPEWPDGIFPVFIKIYPARVNEYISKAGLSRQAAEQRAYRDLVQDFLSWQNGKTIK